MKEIKIKAIEKIVTYQGEGFDAGERMLLIRTKNCDRVVEAKSPCEFCDTLKKMQTGKEEEHSLDELQQVLYSEYAGLLITGGEPTFSYHFQDTLDMLTYLDYRFANVESNGFALDELIRLAPSYKNIRYVFSPKIFSDDDLRKAIKTIVNVGYLPNLLFKIVIEKNENKHLNLFLNYLLKQKNFNDRIYLMPEGKTGEEIIKNSKKCISLCDLYKVNFSSRDHVIYNFA